MASGHGMHRHESRTGAAVRYLTLRSPPTLWDPVEDPGDHDVLGVSAEAVRLMGSELRKATLPLDQLPYTSSFDRLVARFLAELPVPDALNTVQYDNVKHGIWQLAIRVRKSGRATPFRQRVGTPLARPALVGFDGAILTSVMPIDWSLRDRLPYSIKLEELRRQYNAKAANDGLGTLNRRECWLAIVSQAKRHRQDPTDSRREYRGQLGLY